MSSIIVSVVLIAIIILICLLLVLVNKRHRQNTAMELVSRFNRLGQENNLSSSHKEILDNFIIGLDEVRKKLFIVKKAGDQYDSLIIDLKEVQHCSKKKIHKSIHTGSGKKERHERYPDKIILEFDYAGKRDPLQIVFFESGMNHPPQMPGLEQKAMEWEMILTKTINNRLQKIA